MKTLKLYVVRVDDHPNTFVKATSEVEAKRLYFSTGIMSETFLADCERSLSITEVETIAQLLDMVPEQFLTTDDLSM